MTEKCLEFRPVVLSDAPMLLEWRNDPATRTASRNGSLVTPQDHEAWLRDSSSNPDRKLSIVLEGGSPVGTVRADRRGEGWELSWTVAPSCRGRGLGPAMVCQFAATLSGPSFAEIKPDNRASIRIAEAAGLRCISRNGGMLQFAKDPGKAATTA